MKPETRQRRRGRTTRAINAYMTDKKGVPAVVRDTYRPVFHFYPDEPMNTGTFIMRTGTGVHGFVDADTGNCRNLQLEDVDIITRLGNHLDQVGFMGTPFVNSVPAPTADILGGVGQLECATVFSPIQAVLDNEMGAMLNKYLQASPVDDESTAWELLQGIDAGGNFLAEEHTARHCRSMFMPRVYQRVDRDSYEANNRRDVMDSALETYREIMDRPIPDLVMEADQIREIEQIVRAADADILAGD